MDKSKVKATCAVTVKPVPVTSVTLNVHDVTIYVGERYQLQATVKPDNASDKRASWGHLSGLPYVAIDRNGMVTGLRPGASRVYCRVGGLEATCRVVVKQREKPVSDVSFAGEYDSVDNFFIGLFSVMNVWPYELTRYLLQQTPSDSQLGELLGGEAGLKALIAGATKVIETVFNWLGSLFTWIQGLFKKSKVISINDWLDAYSKPSQSGGRDVTISSDRISKWSSYGGSVGVNEIKGKGYMVIENANGAVVNENGRHWIAVGPRVLNPDYPNTGTLGWKGDENLSPMLTNIDILVKKKTTGELSYIYAIVGSLRAHTYSPDQLDRHGIIHNGVPYPESWNAKNEKNPNTGTNVFPGDLTSVEFYRTVPSEEQRAFSAQYEIIKMIVY